MVISSSGSIDNRRLYDSGLAYTGMVLDGKTLVFQSCYLISYGR